MGYQALYASGDGDIFILGTELYRDSAGAHDAFAWYPSQMSAEDYFTQSVAAAFAGEMFAIEGVLVSAARISFPRLGDESGAWKVQIGGDLAPLTMYSVGLRVGRAGGVATLAAEPGQEALVRLEDLATRLSAKMAESLD